MTYVLSIMISGCAQSPPAPDVLLVTWDTVRADRVHCERMGIPCTPFFSELAETGVVFTEARSTTPETLPSHSSLMTGLYPASHGARVNGLFSLSDEVQTLAEQYQAAGYATGGFVSAGVLNAQSGIGQGFEMFDTLANSAGLPYRAGVNTTAAAVSWLNTLPPEQPTFLWLHLFDAHRPLVPTVAQLRKAGGDPYQAQIHTVDHQTRRMVDALRASGRLDNSLIVITADHGEDLGDHGEETHSIFAYDSTVRIPMLWWWGESVSIPALRGSTISAPVSLVDVAPTLAALTGQPALPSDGLSLAATMQGEALPERTLLVESVTPSYSLQTKPIFGFIDLDQHAWFDVPKPEHYDLNADPGQQVNLYTDEDADTLAGLRAQFDRQWPPADQKALDEPTLQQLSALGYIGLDGSSSQSNTDAKDFIETIQFGIRSGLSPEVIVATYRELLATEGYTTHLLESTVSKLEDAGALLQVEAILAELPDQQADLAARQQLRREKEVLVTQIQRFLNTNPAPQPRANALFDLGNTLYYLEQLTEAEKALQQSLQLNPSDTQARHILGTSLARLDRPEEAIEVVRQVTPLRHCEIGRISSATSNNDRTVMHLTECMKGTTPRSQFESRILVKLLFPRFQ